MHVVVVGGGLAGLTAATDLVAGGHQVTVFDKGPLPGGRLATSRLGSGRFDEGAQFFTIRSDRFAAMVQPHIDAGLVFEWCRGFSTTDVGGGGDGYPRYAVGGGMSALTALLAEPLSVRCNSLVFAIRPGVGGSGTGSGWTIALDDGSSVSADALVVTCPLPQSYSLLVTAEVAIPDDLVRSEYDRTIAMLVNLADTPLVPEPGGLQNPTDVLGFVADNQRKGISDSPALTVHASAAWSAANWEQGPAEIIAALTEAAAEFIGDAVVLDTRLKKWRFATPRTIWPDPCWIADDGPGPLVLAGDAFAGPKVEGAVLSGIAAAAALLA